jgi:hypothetical protein
VYQEDAKFKIVSVVHNVNEIILKLVSLWNIKNLFIKFIKGKVLENNKSVDFKKKSKILSIHLLKLLKNNLSNLDSNSKDSMQLKKLFDSMMLFKEVNTKKQTVIKQDNYLTFKFQEWLIIESGIRFK